MNIGEIITVVTSIVAIVSVVMKVRSDARHESADRDRRADEAERHATEIETLKNELSKRVVDQASGWLQTQGVMIDNLKKENAELRTRIEELERNAKQCAQHEQELANYVEYLLAGIRVLIQQGLDRDELPQFDPVSLADFLTGRNR